jgi:V/A-type H+-transporting ATPase subunit D
MAEQLVATRAELIRLKGRIKLAKSGYALLKKKRDGLIMEFFALLERAKTIRSELDALYRQSLDRVNVARVLEGDVRVRSVALGMREQPHVAVSTKNVIGVAVPQISGITPRQAFSLFDSITITEAAEGYESVIQKVILAAEIETAIRKLLAEIEKTKRRVNALEYEIIPRLERDRAAIMLRLDELERETFFRLKRSKARLAAEQRV